MLHVSEFMSQPVMTAHADDGIRATFFRMREAAVRHVPVVSSRKEIRGIISDRDLRRPDWVDESFDISHHYNLDDDLCVGDLMTRNVSVVNHDDPLEVAGKILITHRFGALPVINGGQMLIGIISSLDLLRALDSLLPDD